MFQSAPARAFCQATTCAVTGENDCDPDARGCSTRGLPLYWPSLCVTYAVEEQGSLARGIPAEMADDAMEQAFRSWVSAPCSEGERPSLGVVALGPVRCGEAEFNFPKDGTAGAPNANILIFRDESWGEDTSTEEDTIEIARTVLTFDMNTGALHDADIEINTFANSFSLPGEPVTQDLLSVLTHEAGHFLGLAHTQARNATMNAQYALDDLAYRTLAEDDIAGICAVYPPDEVEFDTCPPTTGPRHGFSRDCGSDDFAGGGCASVAGGSARASGREGRAGGWWAGLALLGLVLAARRRA